MGLFPVKKKHTENNSDNLRTTANFFLGAAEAEGEANNTLITLNEVFEDFLDILSHINNEKFIITGRKGSGKSAIGEYIYSFSQNEPNIFCDFIKKSDVNIEEIVQIGNENYTSIEYELLFKWIILTKILKLISINENIQNFKEIKNLKLFLERNRGFIDIRRGEIIEIIRETGYDINLEYFKRLYSAVFKKNIKIKESKAAFYKLIPYLEETILNILQNDRDNNYILIFDDLDIGYYAKAEQNLFSLADLLRVAKYYNNEFFGRNKLESKIIILLRNDIVKHLTYQADTAKIFASYSVELKWYEDAYKYQEDNLKIKQFINKRIKTNFEKLNLDYTKDKPWESFINEIDFSNNHGKTSFKYLIDHTFYRPRDLVLIFKDISTYNFPIPISKVNLNYLLGRYSSEVMLEIQNELSAVFKPHEIDAIFNILRKYEDKRPFEYQNLYDSLVTAGFNNVESVIEELFFYSLIGNIKDDTMEVNFKFREKRGEIYQIDIKEKFILHYILKVYFSNY